MMPQRTPRLLLPLALAGTVCACPDPKPVIPEVQAWLECEECLNGELDSLMTIGQPAFGPLNKVLDEGPPPERLERLERYLDSLHGELLEYSEAHSTERPPPRGAYVRAFTGRFRDLYRIRAAIGVAAIGGPAAREALESAAEDSSRVAVVTAVRYALDSICGNRDDPSACR